MNEKIPYNKNNITERPLEHYMGLFREADPAEMAARTGVHYDGKSFHLQVMGQERIISWPDFEDEGWGAKDKILFLHYLLEGKKVDPVSEFAAYNELPWGDVYDKNFRGRCVRRLVGMFGNRLDAFHEVCKKFGGTPTTGSGVGYDIEFMPGLFIKLIIWEGDEEFPSSGQILFSKNFPDAFAAEDRVIVCELMLSLMK